METGGGVQEKSSENIESNKEHKYDGLKEWQFYAYGVGHFMNDLGGAIYFNYLLYFLKRIVATTSAPGAFLAGQITDGLATPLVGFLSDRTHTRFGRQRKPWYVGGFIVFLIGYFPIYQNIRKLYPSISIEAQTAYYVVFMCIVNIGWAAVQIGHMSLVPSLTYSLKRRVIDQVKQDRLNNKRNSFTFLSNLLILGMGIILFATMSNPTLEINILSYAAAGIGIPAGLFFIFGIDEVKLSNEASAKLSVAVGQNPQGDTYRKLNLSTDQIDESVQRQFKWTHWFKMPSFYMFGLCYMGVRLYCNLFGTLLPFYLVDVLELGDKEQIANNEIPFQVALIGLILYLSQYIVSLFTIKIYTRFGRKRTLFVGLVLCFVTSLTMTFLGPNSSGVMYFVAVLVGMAETLVLSTGINLISDVVGVKSKKGAFVFGMYSLADKFASGLAIYFITASPLFEQSVSFKKWTIILVPSIACILSCAMVLLGPVKEYSSQSQQKKLNSQDDDLAV